MRKTSEMNENIWEDDVHKLDTDFGRNKNKKSQVALKECVRSILTKLIRQPVTIDEVRIATSFAWISNKKAQHVLSEMLWKTPLKFYRKQEN